MSEYTTMIENLLENQKKKKGNVLSGISSITNQLKKEKENEDKKTVESTALASKEIKPRESIVSQRDDLRASDSIKDIEIPKERGKIGLAFDKAKSGLSSATDKLAGIKPSYLNAADQGGQMVAEVVDPQGEGAATVGSMALSGASIGSVVPGIGTAIGAVVGLGLGLIKAESNKKANQDKRNLAAAGVMGEALQKQADFRQLRLGQLNGPNRDLKF